MHWGQTELMPQFSRMFVLFAVPHSGCIYNVRFSLLQPFAPTSEFQVKAARLYEWLKRYGYEWNACSVHERADVILAHISAAQIEELRFVSEPLLEGSRSNDRSLQVDFMRANLLRLELDVGES